jgi:acetylglutamate kinase
VIDLSERSAFAATPTAALVSATAAAARRHGLRPDERNQAAIAGARWSRTPAATRPPHCSPSSRCTRRRPRRRDRDRRQVGISGAGKAPTERTHFSENHGSVAAYGVFSHRHTAEIEQELGRRVTFVPHLVPLDRGILETIYARCARARRGADRRPAADSLRRRPFVRLTGERCPRSSTSRTPTSATSAGRWTRARRIVLVAVLDNLVKGAAGSAVQNSQLMLGSTSAPAAVTRRLSRRPRLVLKLGGELLEQPADLRAWRRGIRALAARAPLVVVHGGGKEIDAALAVAGIPKRQVDGLRVTDAATLDVVVSVLAGAINTRSSPRCVVPADAGRTDRRRRVRGDGQTRARRFDRSPATRRSRTGGHPVDDGAPDLVTDLLADGYVPVIACIGATRTGQLLNVNADTLAAHLARRIGATRLVIAGGTPACSTAPGRPFPADRSRRGPADSPGHGQQGHGAKLHACRAAVRTASATSSSATAARFVSTRSQPAADARRLHTGGAMKISLDDIRHANRSTCCRPTSDSRSPS